MSLFPRFHSEITPLFRLLDDYDRVARSTLQGSSTGLHSFAPKFDVKEIQDAYELHGELPGIEQQNINIEWSDGNTLTISGRSEHRSGRGTPTKSVQEQRVIGEDEGSKTSDEHYQKPTVEDDSAEKADVSTAVTRASNTTQEVSNPTTNAGKYWVSERSVGEFHRSFSFPARVDQEAVKASLKNGILSIVVPKAKKPEPRKIQVNVD